jgi:hypothetical protein
MTGIEQGLVTGSTTGGSTVGSLRTGRRHIVTPPIVIPTHTIITAKAGIQPISG